MPQRGGGKAKIKTKKIEIRRDGQVRRVKDTSSTGQEHANSYQAPAPAVEAQTSSEPDVIQKHWNDEYNQWYYWNTETGSTGWSREEVDGTFDNMPAQPDGGTYDFNGNYDPNGIYDSEGNVIERDSDANGENEFMAALSSIDDDQEEEGVGNELGAAAPAPAPAPALAPAGEASALAPSLAVEEVTSDEPCSRIVSVQVIQGKSLKAMDNAKSKSGGSSDAFVTLSMKDQKDCKTKVVKKSLDPRWDEKFEFEIAADAGSDARLLKVVVKDKDMLKSEFMGGCEIDLSELVLGENHQQWHLLLNQKGNKEYEGLGEVELRIRVKERVGGASTGGVPPPPKQRPTMMAKMRARGMAKAKQVQEAAAKKATQAVAKAKAVGEKQSNRLISNVKAEFAEPTGVPPVASVALKRRRQVSVHVVQARSLKAMDNAKSKSGGSSDAFVTLSMKDQKDCKTKVVKKSLDPSWGENFSFDVDADSVDAQLLKVVVKDKDMLKSEFMGGCKIDVSSFAEGEEVRGWHVLQGENGEEQEGLGELELVIQCRVLEENAAADGTGSVATAPKRRRQVSVHVVQARSLKAMDNAKSKSGGSSDAFVTLSMKDQKDCKTKVVKKSLDPSWGENFSFDVDADSVDAQLLKVVVKDKDMLKSEFMGGCKIDVSSFAEGEEVRGWHVLQGENGEEQEGLGELELVIQCRVLEENAAADGTGSVATAPKRRRRVSVHVVQARSLKAMDNAKSKSGGSSDAFVTLSMKDQKDCKTKVVKKSLDPSWGENFSFDVDADSVDAQLLKVVVKDKDMLKSEFMGGCEIDVSSFAEGEEVRGWHVLQGENGEEQEGLGELELVIQCRVLEENAAADGTGSVATAPKRRRRVSVHVVQARSLKAMDNAKSKSGGSSDAFVTLSMKDQKDCKTKVVKKSLDPSWGENFSFDVDADSVDAQLLKVVVKDKDMLKSEFMGGCEIDVSSFAEGEEVRGWHVLQGENGEEQEGLGELELVIQCRVLEENAAADGTGSVTTAPKRRRRVSVHVVQARSLKAMDNAKSKSGGSSDAFVTLSMKDQKDCKTKVVKKSLDPSWGENFSFDVDADSVDAQLLKVVVKDKDMLKSEFMGGCEIDVSSFAEGEEVRGWHVLQGENGEEQEGLGELELVIQCRVLEENAAADGTGSVATAPKRRRRVSVHVVQARSLKAMDNAKSKSGGSSDAFVTLSMKDQKDCKTKVVKKSLDPSWGENFSFDVDADSVDAQLLKVVVKDKDMLKSEFMGGCEIDVSSFAEGEEVRGWHVLQGENGEEQEGLGELELVIQCRVLEENAAADGTGSVATAPKRRRQVSVHVVQARSLKAMDNAKSKSGGSSDAFVTLSMKDQKDCKTKVVKKSLDPSWGENFSFDVDADSVDAQLLKVVVKDKDMLKSEFMGGCEIDVSSFAEGEEVRGWHVLQGENGEEQEGLGELELVIQCRVLVVPYLSCDLSSSKESLSQTEETNENRISDEGVVEVNVIQARRLIAMDNANSKSGGSSDAFVTLSMKDQKECSTKIVKKSLRPSWDETFEFQIAGTGNAQILKVVVKDKDMLKSEFMGGCEIDLSLLPIGEEMRDWHKLRLDTIQKNRSTYRRAVSVHVVQARSLKAMDNAKSKSGGSSDAFVTLSMKDQKDCKTKVVKKSLDPSWGENFSFDVDADSVDAQLLKVVVKDKDMLKSEFMGGCEIDVSSFAEGEEVRGWHVLQGENGEEQEGLGELELVIQNRRELADIGELELAFTRISHSVVHSEMRSNEPTDSNGVSLAHKYQYPTKAQHIAATHIQRVGRGMLARRRVRERRELDSLLDLADWRDISLVRNLQARFRGRLARREYRRRIALRELLERATPEALDATVRLQARWRGYLGRQIARARNAAAVINLQFGTAAANGHVLALLELHKHGADPNSIVYVPQWVKREAASMGVEPLQHGKYRASPFWLGCFLGSLDVCRALIRFKADVTACTLDQTSPLCIASEEGHTDLLHFLLKTEGVREQMQLEALSEGRFTALYQACRRDHFETVEALLAGGADIEAADPRDGSTPLYIAAREGHVRIVEALHAKGADAMVRVREVGDHGEMDMAVAVDTPFLAACRNGHMEVVQYLTQSGCTGGAVHPYDAAFLEDLYVYTDGDNWTNNAGWDRCVEAPGECFGVEVENGHVKRITLTGNNLMGVVPQSIGQCKLLQCCRLDFNQLIGPIPDSIGGNSVFAGCKELKVLGLAGNQLEGDIPTTLVNCKKLTKLMLSHNRLTGIREAKWALRDARRGALNIII